MTARARRSTGIPTTTKTISALTRRRNSHDGNPRYQVSFTDGTWGLTGVDASVGYEVTHSMIGKTVTVTYNYAGFIIGLDPTETGATT